MCTFPSSASAIDAAVGRAIILVRANRHADAAHAYLDAVAREPQGHAGWMLPVEPMLNPLAHPDIWAKALSLVRLRAM